MLAPLCRGQDGEPGLGLRGVTEAPGVHAPALQSLTSEVQRYEVIGP